MRSSSPSRHCQAAALAFAACAAPVHAAGVVGTGSAVSCTEAALDAALAGGGLVTFNCGSGFVSIPITTTKLLASDTTLDGSNGQIVLAGNNAVRLFSMGSPVNFTLRRLMLATGYHASHGGAIYAMGPSALTLTDVRLSHNRAAPAVGGGGGAIYTTGGVATTLTRVDASENDGDTGGAVYASHADDTLALKEFYAGENGAEHGGGVIDFRGKRLTIEASLFDSNGTLAGGGGALRVTPSAPGALTITNTTFRNNRVGDAGPGAAIYLSGAPGSTITNSTLAGNAGDGSIWADANTQLTLANTIVSDTEGGPNCWFLAPAVLADGGHNLQFGGTVVQSCGASIQEADPRLDGLIDNGGFTSTMALLPGSPAIDAASGCPATDQRGYARPAGVACDIGAFEAGAAAPPAGDGGGAVASVPAVGPAGLALLSALVAGLVAVRRRKQGFE